MNTEMFNHPITEVQLETVATFGISIIPPVAKKLMCGDIGVGAMAELPTILECVQEALSSKE